MTPEESATRLVNKYLRCRDRLNFCYILPVPEDAKQCALIAVDLAIEVETNIFKGEVNKSYWQEVKQEILKL